MASPLSLPPARPARTSPPVIARSTRGGQGASTKSRAAMRGLLRLCFALLGLWIFLLALWAVAPPVSTLMLARWATLRPVRRVYVPLKDISPSLRVAVLTSEDERFCMHAGVDWTALFGVVERADGGMPTRGASTVPMQTVKNLFLWPSRSAVRKGLEIPMALGLDAAWSKRRILEVYLNIAEWGEGLFGAEAASRFYFHKHASALTTMEADLLATSLPDPLARIPNHPDRLQKLLARRLAERAANARAYLRCIE